MKLRVILITAVFAMSFLITGSLYAGNGDLIVNGNLGVHTPTPAAEAEVNGNMIVDSSLTVKGNATTTGTTTMTGTATMNGNAIVNGNLGVGTSSPAQKLDVNGKVKGTGFCIGTNCTTTLQVSGGLYGYCLIDGGNCGTVKSPASCSIVSNPFPAATCSCPTGYTVVSFGTFYACYKN